MKQELPITIINPAGETLIFREIIKSAGGDKILGENKVMPRCGPPMHVHWLQDEGFTVKKGMIGYQVAGQSPQYATTGDSIVFKRGVPHKFWNAGDEVLECSAWLQPANTFVYFISSIFEAQKKTGTSRPEIFDTAYLLVRYKSEYDMLEIPLFVRKLIFPIIYCFGKLTGKYKHFTNAPEPVKN